MLNFTTNSGPKCSRGCTAPCSGHGVTNSGSAHNSTTNSGRALRFTTNFGPALNSTTNSGPTLNFTTNSGPALNFTTNSGPALNFTRNYSKPANKKCVKGCTAPCAHLPAATLVILSPTDYGSRGDSAAFIQEDLLAREQIDLEAQTEVILITPDATSTRNVDKRKKRKQETLSEQISKKKRFQPRIGQNDWEILEEVSKLVAKLLEVYPKFSELLLRKSITNNSKFVRHNLATMDQNELLRIYTVIKKSQYRTEGGSVLVDCEAARAQGVSVFREEKTRRFCVTVSGEEPIILRVYTIMFYFEPSPCWFKISDGKLCGKLHRTVYEYNSAHPAVDVSRLGLSHLWHESWSISPAQMVIEPNNTNSRRNICRAVCICDQEPPCYSDPHQKPKQ